MTASTAVWLNKATPKKGSNIGLDSPLSIVHGGALSCDKYRIHLVGDPGPCDCGEKCFIGHPVVESHLKAGRDSKVRFEVSVKHLDKLAHGALAFVKDSEEKTMRMAVNGILEVSAESKEIGEYGAELVDGDAWAEWRRDKKYRKTPLIRNYPSIVRYSHSGPDSVIYLNAKYLIDALSGMQSEAVQMSITLDSLYMTDGEREAVIMRQNYGTIYRSG